MNALVTGGSGFLGRYLVKQLLERGDTVRVLCRARDKTLDDLGVETVLADLCDRDATIAACESMNLVFHVAGVSGIWGPWEHFYKINTEGTKHVVEGCRKHGVHRLVYTSSPSVTFDGNAQEGVDESAPYSRHWLCHYPHSKALAEQHVLEANETDGLSTCALRPHLMWGPGDRQLIPRLFERARQGKLRRVGDGSNLIDSVYVENAAAAHLQAADALEPGSRVAGKAYFITQGTPVRCWKWINQLLFLVKLPPVSRSISTRSAWRLGAMLERFYRLFHLKGEPRMTRFLAAQLGTSHYFSIQRARRDFGYHPKVSSVEGMHRMALDLAANP